MNDVRKMAGEFLTATSIAVAGVSNKTDDAANYNYRTLKKRGWKVFAINPNYETFDGDTCFPNLQSLPEQPEALLLVTRPEVTARLVDEAIELGIKKIWMHRAVGTTSAFQGGEKESISSVSETAVRRAHSAGCLVIPGSCPMQFAGDPGHKCMGWFFQWTGGLKNPLNKS